MPCLAAATESVLNTKKAKEAKPKMPPKPVKSVKEPKKPNNNKKDGDIGKHKKSNAKKDLLENLDVVD